MGRGFHDLGTVYLNSAKVGLNLECSGANFRYAKGLGDPLTDRLRVALFGYVIHVGGNITLSGLESDGAVMLGGATIGGDLDFDGGRFSNPDRVAIFAPGIAVGGNVVMGDPLGSPGPEITGIASFSFDHVENSFYVIGAKFLGSASEPHGFNGEGMDVRNALVWQRVILRDGGTLDLTGAKVGSLEDDERSWPAPGKLLIDRFSYNFFGSDSPQDVASRLRWLGLQAQGFHTSAYTQLAATYRNAGLDPEAIQVSIAGEDARYATHGLVGRAGGAFLKATIGYGHRPLPAVIWSFLVIMLGWMVVAIGASAGLMRPTWPENPPATEKATYPRLYPLLYSLDVFLPFVNLHQERYWWPNADGSGDCMIFGREFSARGSVVQYYLWLQILSGWVLSAIFVAGVTGLVKTV